MNAFTRGVGRWCLMGWLCLLIPLALRAQAVVNTPQVRAELRVHAPQGVAPGHTVWLGLQLQHQPQWHTYWKNAGDSGLPTQLEWTLPPGVKAGPIAWPLPGKLTVGDLTNYGFEGQALLGVPLTLTAEFNPPGGLLEVKLKASWLVCRQECIPQEGLFQIAIPTQSSQAAHASDFEALQKEQPRTLSTQDIQAEVGPESLRIRIGGWPAPWIGQPLSIYPELNEVVEAAAERHPKARQAWQGQTWTAELPLSAMRSTEPKRMPLLLVAGAGAQRQGMRIELPISGRWPAIAPTPSFTAPSLPAAGADTAVQRLPATDGGNDLSWWGALLGAFLGGLILNLMPCVLPVLAIKTLRLAQPGTPAAVRHQEGWGYAAGVMASMLALGATIMGLKAAGQQLGWGFQLQSPLVVASLALLFTLIALNLWGLFTVHRLLPQALTQLSSRRPALDAFLSGVLAVAVATPCTAPFMGASVGLALGLPGWQGLSIFAALGAGLALPLVLVIALPGLARWLPRPGPWMETLRQALGFPMLATVIWLLWVLGHQVGIDASMQFLGLLLLLGSWLWVHQLGSGVARRASAILFVALVAAAAWSLPSLLINASGNRVESSDSWQPWSEANVSTALQAGKPVFVDYTAAWCITCQVNKRTTLNQSDVQKAFASRQVVLLRADWTRQDPAITASLSQFGRSGVPVYVLHRPGQTPLLLSELLSPGAVLDALSTLAP